MSPVTTELRHPRAAARHCGSFMHQKKRVREPESFVGRCDRAVGEPCACRVIHRGTRGVPQASRSIQALVIHVLFESGAMHGPSTLPAFRNGSGMRGSCMIPQMVHKPGTVLEALDLNLA
jgi:hypothetical protein